MQSPSDALRALVDDAVNDEGNLILIVVVMVVFAVNDDDDDDEGVLLSFLAARWAKKEDAEDDDDSVLFPLPLPLPVNLARLVNGEFLKMLGVEAREEEEEEEEEGGGAALLLPEMPPCLARSRSTSDELVAAALEGATVDADRPSPARREDHWHE